MKTSDRGCGWRLAPLLFFISLFVSAVAVAEADSGKNKGSSEAGLEEKVEVLTEEVSRLREQMNIPETDKELEGAYGMGPAASKVYGVSHGISFGGYGEFYFAAPYGDTEATGKVNTTDFYRFITYIGYKFNDWIVMNGEIEYEHATTSSNYQGKSGSVSVEFAYLDFLFTNGFNIRGGNLVVPMGFLNLVHLGAHGGLGDFKYSVYALNGLNGTKFDEKGVRGGRQKGNRAIWEDVGGVVALDYIYHNVLRMGGSAYWGGADQGLVSDQSGAVLKVENRIYEGHVEYRRAGFRTRALVTASQISNAGALSWALYGDDDQLSQQVPKGQFGWYLEAGYDIARLLWKKGQFTLTPWLRYEDYNFQNKVSADTGLPPDPTLDGTLLTAGLEIKPHPNVVVKLDWVHPTDKSDEPTSDEIRLGAGFIY
jgi:hypothetical protein